MFFWNEESYHESESLVERLGYIAGWAVRILSSTPIGIILSYILITIMMALFAEIFLV